MTTQWATKPRKRQQAKSMRQARQRELSWILYITEGYAANLSHALAVNCVTFSNRDKAMIGATIARIDVEADHLRQLMLNNFVRLDHDNSDT